jgi:hypothetical protein
VTLFECHSRTFVSRVRLVVLVGILFSRQSLEDKKTAQKANHLKQKQACRHESPLTQDDIRQSGFPFWIRDFPPPPSGRFSFWVLFFKIVKKFLLKIKYIFCLLSPQVYFDLPGR